MEPGYTPAFARVEGRRAWVGVVVYAFCIAVGMFSPIAALVLFAAVAVFYAITSQGAQAQ